MFAKKNRRRQLYRMLISTPNNKSLYRWRKRPFQMWPAIGCWLAVRKKPWPAAALVTNPVKLAQLDTNPNPNPNPKQPSSSLSVTNITVQDVGTSDVFP